LINRAITRARTCFQLLWWRRSAAETGEWMRCGTGTHHCRLRHVSRQAVSCNSTATATDSECWPRIAISLPSQLEAEKSQQQNTSPCRRVGTCTCSVV